MIIFINIAISSLSELNLKLQLRLNKYSEDYNLT